MKISFHSGIIAFLASAAQSVMLQSHHNKFDFLDKQTKNDLLRESDATTLALYAAQDGSDGNIDKFLSDLSELYNEKDDLHQSAATITQKIPVQ